MKINNMFYKVRYDKNINNSYINKTRKEIFIRRKFDLLHEVLHAVMSELKLDKDIEEFLVTFLSERLERIILENNLDIYMHNFLFS